MLSANLRQRVASDPSQSGCAEAYLQVMAEAAVYARRGRRGGEQSPRQLRGKGREWRGREGRVERSRQGYGVSRGEVGASKTEVGPAQRARQGPATKKPAEVSPPTTRSTTTGAVTTSRTELEQHWDKAGIG